jgi:hypothetical protein
MRRNDRAFLIETRSANFIRASGHVPRKQAGHMTAPDRGGNQVKILLAMQGPSTHEAPRRDKWNLAESVALNG